TGPNSFTQPTEDITGLEAGTYNISVTDVNSCTSVSSLVITQPTVLGLANSGNISLLCNGATTGTGSFTASGGTTPYGFVTVSNSTGGNIVTASPNVTFTNAGAGKIVIRVTDANGCSVLDSVTITEPTPLNLVSVLSTSIEGSHNINCNGGTGSIGLSITGGVSPYVYSWTTVGGSGLVAGAANQNALTAGAYSVVVTDANACTVPGNFTLTQPAALAVAATTDDAIIGTCKTAQLGGTFTGGVEIGGGGYTYSWSPATGLTSTIILNPVASPANTTTYTLTVTDANNCVNTSNVLITVKPALTAVATTDDNNIGTCSSANLDVNVSGGEDFGPGLYTYSWSPAAGLSATNIKNPVATPAANETY
ncbi:MAG: hypothetical protein J0653_05895, partial [Deltaproteobacteria bacterium]|nr:hypothetical protein [Deltaproteobacteria bacterium]